MGALVIFVGFLTLLIVVAAPFEVARRLSPEFDAWLNRLVERVL